MKLAQLAAVPLKSEQLELDSTHPFPLVMHPNLYVAQAESVTMSAEAFEQILTEQGVDVSNLQKDL